MKDDNRAIPIAKDGSFTTPDGKWTIKLEYATEEIFDQLRGAMYYHHHVSSVTCQENEQ